MPADTDIHKYRMHWRLPVALMVGGGAAQSGLALALDLPRWWIWLLNPVVIFGLSWIFGPSLKLSPSGVSLGFSTASWDDVVLVRSRFGESLRTRTKRRFGVNVLLWMYARSWRTGRVGDDLRRWAPALLDPAS